MNSFRAVTHARWMHGGIQSFKFICNIEFPPWSITPGLGRGNSLRRCIRLPSSKRFHRFPGMPSGSQRPPVFAGAPFLCASLTKPSIFRNRKVMHAPIKKPSFHEPPISAASVRHALSSVTPSAYSTYIVKGLLEASFLYEAVLPLNGITVVGSGGQASFPAPPLPHAWHPHCCVYTGQPSQPLSSP